MLFLDNLEKQGDLLKIRLNHLADEIDMRVLLIIIEVENAAKKLQNTLKELKKGKIKYFKTDHLFINISTYNNTSEEMALK